MPLRIFGKMPHPEVPREARPRRTYDIPPAPPHSCPASEHSSCRRLVEAVDDKLEPARLRRVCRLSLGKARRHIEVERSRRRLRQSHVDLRREIGMDWQPAGKSALVAVEPAFGQDLPVAGAWSEREQRIFDERALGVLGLDRCSKAARL